MSINAVKFICNKKTFITDKIIAFPLIMFQCLLTLRSLLPIVDYILASIFANKQLKSFNTIKEKKEVLEKQPLVLKMVIICMM